MIAENGSGVDFYMHTSTAARQSARKHLIHRIKRYKLLYIMLIPIIAYFFVFSYWPYWGLQIAFRDYKIYSGMAASPWSKPLFKNFINFFDSPDFMRLIINTLYISFQRILWGFPVPILFALVLNEVRAKKFKRLVQTITYFPNFLSWAVYAGIIMVFIQPTGIINKLFVSAGWEAPNILVNRQLFVPMLIVTAIMKSFGFSAIIYLSALSGIDEQLYEAAIVDGAKRLRQIWHVTLPGIRSTICVMLIFAVSGVLNAGFDQIFNFYNASVKEVADIIDTYVYRMGLENGRYSLATVVGLFKGVIGFILLISANAITRRLGEAGIW